MLQTWWSERRPLPEDEQYTMATPDKAWATMVAAWSMLKSERIMQDIDRFVPAIRSIIAADGAYVSDKDLRNGHRRLMRSLVRGGAPHVVNDGVSPAARLQKGLADVKESWEGMTAAAAAKLEAARAMEELGVAR